MAVSMVQQILLFAKRWFACGGPWLVVVGWCREAIPGSEGDGLA